MRKTYKPETALKLRWMHLELHPNSHFFDKKTLKFFGETLSTMRLLKDKLTVTDSSGEKHTCYVLSSRQRLYNGKTRRFYHYFDENTLEHVIT